MDILEKVRVNPNICGIQLDFNGALSPEHASTIQNFYNSTSFGNIWNDAYFGKKSVSFRETSKKSKAGLSFTQVLEIKFPSNDSSRSDRMGLFEKTKFIKLILDNGTAMVMGRNDYFQNKFPEVSITSDEAITTVKFISNSIFSLGFINDPGASNSAFEDILPHDIPIAFINI